MFNIQSDIADKAGRLPEPPQVLIDAIEEAKAQGRRPTSIEIRFTGPLAIAREMAFKMQPINNSLAALERIAILFPNALKKIKEMELTEEALDANNFPSHLMRSDEEVEAMIQAEQELIQQQQAMEMAGGMAEAYPKMTGAPEAGSPAEAMGAAIGS